MSEIIIGAMSEREIAYELYRHVDDYLNGWLDFHEEYDNVANPAWLEGMINFLDLARTFMRILGEHAPKS